MAVVATVAAALAALLATVASGGVHLGWITVPPALYAIALVPAVAAVATGRRPAPKGIPKNVWRFISRHALAATVAMVLLLLGPVLAGPGGVAAVAAVGTLAPLVLCWWWPSPPFLKASVVLSAVSLFHPGIHPARQAIVLVLLAVSAAVALVASNRLAAADHPQSGGSRRPTRPGRVTGETAVVVAAMLLGLLVSTWMNLPLGGAGEPDDPESMAGDQPLGDSTDLDLLDAVDPGAAGAGRRSGRDRALLKVGSERPVLRAVTYDRWDGHRWTRSSNLRVPVRREEDWLSVLGTPRQNDGGRQVFQRVKIEAAHAGVAVATPNAFHYEVPGGAKGDLDGTVRLVPSLGRGAVYRQGRGCWKPLRTSSGRGTQPTA